MVGSGWESWGVGVEGCWEWVIGVESLGDGEWVRGEG